jgi:hypothetical protein
MHEGFEDLHIDLRLPVMTDCYSTNTTEDASSNSSAGSYRTFFSDHNQEHTRSPLLEKILPRSIAATCQDFCQHFGISIACSGIHTTWPPFAQKLA